MKPIEICNLLCELEASRFSQPPPEDKLMEQRPNVLDPHDMLLCPQMVGPTNNNN